MNIFYGKTTIIALVIWAHSICFGMDQSSICEILPLETNKIIFGFCNLYSQDQLRATCPYWKEIGNARTERVYLLNLLHSPSNTTTQTRTRILFDAVYHGNHDLVEHILKGAPKWQLAKPFYSSPPFTLYSIAQKTNDQKMIDLVGKYNTSQCKIIDILFKHPILIELLVSCISGNSDAVKKIIAVEFKTEEVCRKIKKDKKDEYRQEAVVAIQDAFNFAVAYDDEQCILAYSEFFKDNSEQDFFIECALKNACKLKNKNAVRALLQLLQQANNINKVSNGSFYDIFTMITIKNQILGGTVWGALEVFDGNQEYRNEIEAIFNEYGGKTYEELEVEKKDAIIGKA